MGYGSIQAYLRRRRAEARAARGPVSRRPARGILDVSSLSVAPSPGPAAVDQPPSSSAGAVVVELAAGERPLGLSSNALPPAADRLLALAPLAGPPSGPTLASGRPLPAAALHVAEARLVLGAALERSTRANYGAGVAKFLEFCDARGVPTDERFPVSGDLLLAFVCSIAGRVRADTVKNYLSALATWHHLWQQPWHRPDVVRLALRGLGRLAPSPKPPRPPVTADTLRVVRAALRVDVDPLHAAVWACALVSWWAVCRLGETTIPADGLVRPARHITRAGIVGAFSHGGVVVVTLRFPWTKSAGERGIEKPIVSAPGDLDPVAALARHLSLSPCPPREADRVALFSFRRGRALVPLTKAVMLGVVADALAVAGRPPVQGHSFRIGGASLHWHAGAPLEDIKMLGGWKRDAFALYLRDPARGLLTTLGRTSAALRDGADPSAGGASATQQLSPS